MFLELCQRASWFAIRVRPHFEQTVFKALQSKGLEAFVPTYREPRAWSDRIKMMEVPLFPGYLFCRIRLTQKLSVLTTPAVRGVVGFGKVPVAVPDGEIEAVQRFVKSELPLKPCPFLKLGQTVVLNRGPLAGMEGILTEFKGQYRVVVSIPLLQRSVAAEVESCWVEAIRSAPKIA